MDTIFTLNTRAFKMPRLDAYDDLAELLKRVQVPTLLVSHDPHDVQVMARSVIRIEGGGIVSS